MVHDMIDLDLDLVIAGFRKTDQINKHIQFQSIINKSIIVTNLNL